MRISQFPNGFSSGLVVRNMPKHESAPGKVYWVGNNTTMLEGELAAADTNLNGKGGTYLRPFSTIDYAIGQCAANRGDIIYVRPGHTATVSAAAGIALDVAGVSIVGLGRGTSRPTINFTATAATLTMSAANCSIHNLLLTGGIDAIVSMVVVSAVDCLISECELKDVTGEMTIGILTTAGASRLRILDHIHNGATGVGTNAAIRIVGGDRIEITAQVIDGNFATGGIDVVTTATTNLYVHDIGRFYTRNSADIFLVDTITASTGQIGPNINLRLTDNAANITEAITGATFVVMDPVYVVNAPGEKAMLINWTASTDA